MKITVTRTTATSERLYVSPLDVMKVVRQSLEVSDEYTAEFQRDGGIVFSKASTDEAQEEKDAAAIAATLAAKREG